MMSAYSVSTKRSLVVAVVALGVVMSGQRAQAQPGTVLSQQKISDTEGDFTGILANLDEFHSTAFLGDLDGDDVGDLAVGAWGDDDGGFNRGAVWILFLNTDGTVKSHQKISSTQGGGPPLDDGDHFGYSVASLGDLDGDGVGDLAVGARGDDDGCTDPLDCDRGAVWILFLNPDGTVKSYQKISSTAGNGPPLPPGVNSLFFNIAVASLGDLDGDGVGDLAVGVPNDDDGGFDQGAVWILFLNLDTTGRDPIVTVKSHHKISDTSGDLPPDALANEDYFGWSVASLGDLDGDGPSVRALAVGVPDDGDDFSGAIWVLFLNTDGTVKTPQKISETQGGFTGILDTEDHFGVSVASLGDLDGDGVGDLAVGAPFDDDGVAVDGGAVWILFLNTNGTVKTHQKISETQGGFTVTLDHFDYFGWSAAGLGDLDGDGVGDLAMGVLLDDDGGFDRGAVWILFLDGICLWDLDANGSVGVSDFLALLGAWGPCPPKGDCPADFDNSGDVGVSDFLALLGNWGPCP